MEVSSSIDCTAATLALQTVCHVPPLRIATNALTVMSSIRQQIRACHALNSVFHVYQPDATLVKQDIFLQVTNV